jgi:DNA helicase-2/ATP-dependent DNA helicase PcrA
MDGVSDPATAMQALSVPSPATADWDAFLTLFRTLCRTRTDWPSIGILSPRGYEPQLQRIYEDAHVRLADLVQLRQIAATCSSRERS